MRRSKPCKSRNYKLQKQLYTKTQNLQIFAIAYACIIKSTTNFHPDRFLRRLSQKLRIILYTQLNDICDFTLHDNDHFHVHTSGRYSTPYLSDTMKECELKKNVENTKNSGKDFGENIVNKAHLLSSSYTLATAVLLD